MAEYLRFVIKTNFIFVEILLAVLSFDCPPAKRQRGKRAKSTYHLHETHCDKYYKCRRGVDREETCPDGMRFNLKHANFGRKCVLPQEGASCGGLTEFRKMQFYKNYIIFNILQFHTGGHTVARQADRQKVIQRLRNNKDSPAPEAQQDTEDRRPAC
ncbi:hypothetical protein GQR58_028722 [Nymphon striatum]|nr:hypothetical protein GQR58_028722 [Nymphon striatum]